MASVYETSTCLVPFVIEFDSNMRKARIMMSSGCTPVLFGLIIIAIYKACMIADEPPIRVHALILSCREVTSIGV